MFSISGTNPGGAVSFHRPTAVEAVEKAVELMGQEFSNVVITAPDGRVYRHTEFHLLIGIKS